MRNYIKIDKALIPYEFDIRLNKITYTFKIVINLESIGFILFNLISNSYGINALSIFYIVSHSVSTACNPPFLRSFAWV